MKKIDIYSGDHCFGRLVKIQVRADAEFDATALEAELKGRLYNDYPIHRHGIKIRRTPNDQRLRYEIVYPLDTIEGKTLGEDEIIGVLAQIERETLEAMRQRDLLGLLE